MPQFISEIEFMKKIIFILLCFLSSVGAMAQEEVAEQQLPTYQFQFDSTTFMLGDQTVLSIQPAPIMPTLEDLTNNDIVAVRQWMDTASGTLYTALTSFEEGEHWLHIGADSVLLTVMDVPNVDTTNTNIRDIADVFRQPYTFGEVAKVVGIVLGILAILVGAYFVINRIRNHKPIIAIPQAPPLPPHTKALNELEYLRQQQLWQQGKVKEYHTNLTDILRNYLEESYHIQSTEMTTDQTLDAFCGSKAYSPEAENMLRQILQMADMVKFAKSEPLPHQHDFSYQQAVQFVTATAPKAETAQPASATDNNQPKE